MSSSSFQSGWRVQTDRVLATNENLIIQENEDLVRAIALRSVSPASDLLDDVVQEGRIALLLASRTWLEDGGASLRTWAAPAIAWRISLFLRRGRKGGFLHKGALKSEQGIHKGTPGRVSFEASEMDGRPLSETVASTCSSPEETAIVNETRETINVAAAGMESRMVDVLAARYCGGSTLEEVGATLGVTRERVRQIEDKALSVLRKRLKRAA